tara:strand:- start:554 stop:721 length:168 start_codon:yes stop_codon:yes gene_type:complete
MKDKWVVIVYDYGEKVSSRIFEGREDRVQVEASEWVISNFGEGKDWVLHHINESW